jgi:hypothetical protein
LLVKILDHVSSRPDSIAFHFIIVCGSFSYGFKERGKEGRREGGRENIREVGQCPGGLHSDGEGGRA